MKPASCAPQVRSAQSIEASTDGGGACRNSKGMGEACRPSRQVLSTRSVPGT